MRPNLHATLHEQLADLCILPGALRERPRFDRHSGGHEWRDTAWRYYECASCGMQAHEPASVTVSCTAYLRLQQQARMPYGFSQRRGHSQDAFDRRKAQQRRYKQRKRRRSA